MLSASLLLGAWGGVYTTALEQEGETRMDKLFSVSTPSDPVYVAVHDEECLADVRLHLHALWER